MREIDNDLFYGLFENPFGDDNETLESIPLTIPVHASGTYTHTSPDWTGVIQVEVIDYPEFIRFSSMQEWSVYQ